MFTSVLVDELTHHDFWVCLDVNLDGEEGNGVRFSREAPASWPSRAEFKPALRLAVDHNADLAEAPS
jgi:hypothetical protein